MTATSVRAGNCHAAPGLSKAFAAPGRRRAGDVGVRGRPVHGMSSMKLRAQPHAALSGTATVPGDKSVSHRCPDVRGARLRHQPHQRPARGRGRAGHRRRPAGHGRRASRASRTAAGGSRGAGAAGSPSPADVLDLGNAGTGARLLMGILAGQPFTSVLYRRRLAAPPADAPRHRAARPHGRRASPARSGGRLPLAVTGRRPLRAIDYACPVASAQVKSAVLLAGLFAAGTTTVRRAPALPRPHRAHAARHGRGGRGRGRAGRRPRRLGPRPGVAGGAEPRRAGRPVVGRLPDRRGPDHARLRGDASAGVGTQPLAHRPLHDAARDGRPHRA